MSKLYFTEEAIKIFIEDAIQSEIGNASTSIQEYVRQILIKIFTRIKILFNENTVEIQERIHCHQCKQEYSFWFIPTKYWRRIPRKLWDKSLCYACYLKEVSNEEEK